MKDLLDDLRFPIGLLFGIFAVILAVAGALYPGDATASGTNLNWFSAAIMGAFSAVMLGMALRARSSRERD
jgi:uncharacterized membrane protein